MLSHLEKSIVLAVLVGVGLPSSPSDLIVQERGGRGPQRADETFQIDMNVIHALLDRRDDIRRKVEELPDGVKTITESDDPALAMLIRGHVEAMHRRLKEQRPIHLRDPLFRALFGQAKQIKLEIKPTEKGVEV